MAVRGQNEAPQVKSCGFLELTAMFWSPVFLCMALIFLASSTPQEDIPYVFAFQGIAFHILAYLILAAFFFRALRNTFSGLSLVRLALISVTFCFLYGISDEFHQVFVPGRSVCAFDVLMDGIGGAIGSMIYPLKRLSQNGKDKTV